MTTTTTDAKGNKFYEQRHSAINIEPAIQELKRGYNPLSCPPGKTLVLLTKARAEGYKVYTPGCDNVDARGYCKGHKISEAEVIAERKKLFQF